MKLGYTIAYVSDVVASIAFCEQAFGLKRRFIHESAQYGELETGETTLAFASHALGESNLKNGYVHADKSEQPLGIEIALVTADVQTAHNQAISVGAIELKEPETKPWGQVVSYVRCPDGTLVEICSPIG